MVEPCPAPFFQDSLVYPDVPSFHGTVDAHFYISLYFNPFTPIIVIFGSVQFIQSAFSFDSF